jgi:hypothetical protein
MSGMGVQLLQLVEVLPQHAGRLDVAVGAHLQEEVHDHSGLPPLAVGALEHVYPGPLACERAVAVRWLASWLSEERSRLGLLLPLQTAKLAFDYQPMLRRQTGLV